MCSDTTYCPEHSKDHVHVKQCRYSARKGRGERGFENIISAAAHKQKFKVAKYVLYNKI